MDKKDRMLLGIGMIILGIVTAISTRKYIFPIGSIMVIGSGLALIFFWDKLFPKI